MLLHGGVDGELNHGCTHLALAWMWPMVRMLVANGYGRLL